MTRGGVRGETARAAMARLKFHPRESLPNRTSLARAEALYTRLTGAPREALARAISDLRISLEAQDSAEITRARSELLAMTSALIQRTDG